MQAEDPTVEIITTLNQDIVHDISFDWYGKRIATCSSDKNVRIYCKNNEGKWIEEQSIQVQGGPLWRVKWARPEFGLILATCSLDRSVKIFEKKKVKFVQQIKLLDSKEGIEDIKFSPRYALGLILATASADGNLRIYEAQEPTNLKSWAMKQTVMVNELGLNCISWNKSQVDKLMLVVGCKDEKTTHKKVVSTQPIVSDKKSLQFFMCDDSGGWKALEFKEAPTDSVNDVSWALTNGRSYHIVAACTDTYLSIYYIRIDENARVVTLLKQFKEEGGGMRLSWNVMGTQLAISEPKRIRIYKNDKGKWVSTQAIQENSQI